MELKPIDKYAETRRAWRLANKEKMAEYARKYYHLRSAKDPEYKQKLNDKERINKMKRENITIQKGRGRPLKYPVYDPVSESFLIV